jgi:hypothetical protein
MFAPLLEGETMPVKNNLRSANRSSGQTPSLTAQKPGEDPELNAMVKKSKQPPGLLFALGGFGLIGWLVATSMQMWTTGNAFFLKVYDDPYFQSLPRSQQGAMMPWAILASAVIALIVQIAVNFVTVRVDIAWKHGYRKDGKKSIKSAAVEVVHQPTLMLAIGGFCHIADGLGDYGYVWSFTHSYLFLGFWGFVCLVGGTIFLPESAQYIWAGFAALREHQQSPQGTTPATA